MTIFRSGIPYDQDLRRLDAAFSPKPGDLFTHEQIADVLGLDAKSHRYQGIKSAWIKSLRRRGLMATGTGRARSIGVMICTGREHQAEVMNQLHATNKKAYRNAVSVEMVNTTGFNEAEMAAHNLLRREVHAVAASAATSVKATRALPPPVSGDNVRVLKSKS